MTEDRRRIATDFDLRSTKYSSNQRHRAYADGLVAQSAIRLGDRVLDAGVGTGFAAIAAAGRVGPDGRVVGVDVSLGMLQQAQLAIEAAGLRNIELLQADACELPDLGDESFRHLHRPEGLAWRHQAHRRPGKAPGSPITVNREVGGT